MTQRRRSAEQWARLVQEWGRSGQTAARFAAARGLRWQTLVWWRWRLKQEAGPVKQAKKAAKTSPLTSVHLVPVQLEAARGDDQDLAWELVAPSGHVLRVYERGGVGVLREALALVAQSGGRR